METYDLVDAGHLGLQDGNCVSDRWLSGESSVGSGHHQGQLLLGDEFGQHFLEMIYN
jgi:hypothetical protein